MLTKPGPLNQVFTAQLIAERRSHNCVLNFLATPCQCTSFSEVQFVRKCFEHYCPYLNVRGVDIVHLVVTLDVVAVVDEVVRAPVVLEALVVPAALAAAVAQDEQEDENDEQQPGHHRNDS